MSITCVNIAPELFLFRGSHHVDNRGFFCKSFSSPAYANPLKELVLRESFFSVSHKNVLRGMHYQCPSLRQYKLVSCVSGCALDVFVSIDFNSPNYGRSWSFSLSSTSATALLIGPHYAHGFLSLADNTVLTYQSTALHVPSKDYGYLWSSINYDWPIKSPIISPRDSSLPKLIQS